MITYNRLSMQHYNCLNCDNALAPSYAFCPACGQRTDIHRISWHDFWHDVVHYVTHADKGVFFVLKQLFLHPGLVVREYLQGKRKKYMSPVTLLLICAGIGYLSINFFKMETVNMRGMKAPSEIRFSSEQAKQDYTQRYERGYNFNRFISKNSKLITIIAIPLLSFFYWLFFIKAGFFYTEHLVANLFVTAFTTLIYALVLMPLVYFAGSSNIFFSATFIFLLLETLYRAWAYYEWMANKGWKKAVKIIFYSAVVTFIWSLFSAGIGFIYISGVFG
jgi:hypothetical protein